MCIRDRYQRRVHGRHKVTEEDFRTSCEQLFSNDQEILTLQREMKASLDKAIMGISPELMQEIPHFLTKDKAMFIFNRILKAFVKDIQEKLIHRDKNNEPRFTTVEEVNNFIAKFDFEQLKMRVLMENGFQDIESPNKMIDYTLLRYSREDPKFGSSIQALRKRYYASLEELAKDIHCSPSFLDEQEAQKAEQSVIFVPVSPKREPHHSPIAEKDIPKIFVSAPENPPVEESKEAGNDQLSSDVLAAEPEAANPPIAESVQSEENQSSIQFLGSESA
eukprot:TRINITY_DN1552_c0_g1_i1.p1 TRINITY_DN1552_c0_g1~~TRINITY_DN1552_c0_g1_i1.p1  ORF type:complete len:277 (+),score=77.99 TRINITY_DN1552_c0_g1_i1:65-895(+)